jgi:hypothetical protein
VCMWGRGRVDRVLDSGVNRGEGFKIDSHQVIVGFTRLLLSLLANSWSSIESS